MFETYYLLTKFLESTNILTNSKDMGINFLTAYSSSLIVYYMPQSVSLHCKLILSINPTHILINSWQRKMREKRCINS